MTDLPWAVQPDGNGFASFGSSRVSDRISFSRNLYQGMFDGTMHYMHSLRTHYPLTIRSLFAHYSLTIHSLSVPRHVLSYLSSLPPPPLTLPPRHVRWHQRARRVLPARGFHLGWFWRCVCRCGEGLEWAAPYCAPPVFMLHTMQAW
jgi:hypothetical protein